MEFLAELNCGADGVETYVVCGGGNNKGQAQSLIDTEITLRGILI